MVAAIHLGGRYEWGKGDRNSPALVATAGFTYQEIFR